ncbi:MAG: hypothetical protein FJX44_04050 [Alphaproteobacteria bacterium]|nr:hypothetical protein [Alphaproteobacteria bacterium]
MLESWTIHRATRVGALAFALGIALPFGAHAQEWVFRGGPGNPGPSIDAYVNQVGPEASIVPHGSLQIDGKSVNCGKRPTVLNPAFDSWGGAFPGFLILNTNKISGLTTQVKLYIYSHECGHQFVGADEIQADLFAIRRGVRWGWLDAQGMEDICVFISKLKGDSVHPPGPKRCETMRKYYQKLIENGTQTTSSPVDSGAHTLGPTR